MPDLTLTTDRLLLRPFHGDDFAAVHAYACDPEVCRYMTWGPNDEAGTRGFLQAVIANAQAEPRTYYDWAVTLRDGGRLLGACGLYRRGEAQQGSLGYCYHRDSWGHGYATEAAAAMVGFGFRELGLHRIEACHFGPNLASGRVMQKLGMQLEGNLREAFQKDGVWYDLAHYAILDREWPGQS
ncbi:MAG TPA: GNAT family N-acetyltransferase [Armatimonadota bacterium]|jgi:RimJ/RimL family protein N-acetyltransferase